MAQKPRIFRLFVSSTFSDMVAERNLLQERVFPALKQFCDSRNARFQAIDLRWGISQEAGLNQRATDLCLSEIARCQRMTRRPNFLLLMGERYGWQPLLDDIPADEWDVLTERISTDEVKALSAWYKHDDNAVPPIYVLQPRQGAFIDQNVWNAVESRLRAILLKALNGLGWSREQRMKYETSVTEQEVEAGIFQYAHAQEGTLCFVRTIDGLPDNNTTYRDASPEAQARLADLKQRLEAHIPDNIQRYQVQWTGDGITFDEDAFCTAVETALKQMIETELATFEEISPLEVEAEAHHAFMLDHTRHVIGRADVLDAVSRYLASDEVHPLVLYGQSGVGKSTVMAKAIESAPDALFRFIGITPDASDIRSLLVSVCEAIRARYGIDDAVPQDYEELIKAFPTFLAHATAEKLLVIFLDALDQLANTNTPSDMRWLPKELPPHVKLVLSVIPSPHLDALKRRLPSESLVEIVPMGIADGEAMLDALLCSVDRTLQPAQRVEVLGKFAQNGLPLYLKLAFEEARLWLSYTNDFALQADVPSLLEGNLFARLSQDAEHGAMLVARSMAYLSASRNGLSEGEMVEMLTRDAEFWQDFEQKRTHKAQREALTSVGQLPIAVWSRLALDLEPYLVERGTDGAVLLNFYHRQFSEKVDALYLAPQREARHAHLASYFKAQTAYTARKTAEQAYQQTKAGLHEDYVATLTDYHYLQAYLEHHGVQMLIEDCGLWEDEAIRLIQSALRMSAHVLNEDTAQWGSQLVGRLMIWRRKVPDILALTDVVMETVPGVYPRFPDSKYDVLPQAGGLLLHTLSGHSDTVNSAVYSQNGRYIVSASWDTTVRVWDTATGTLLKSLSGHENNVDCAAYSPDGRYIVSASWDKTIRVWDSATGVILQTLLGHKDWVNSAEYSLDGRYIVSASWDKTVQVWDAATGMPLQTLLGHEDHVTKAIYSPDGHYIVSASTDKTVRVWDAATGMPLQTLLGHMAPVRSVAYSPDGIYIASASDDRTVRVWDAAKGILLQTLVGHTDKVNSAVYSPTGHYILSASVDRTVRVWNTAKGTLLQTLSGHAWTVNNAAYSPDGHYIISASDDKTVRVWDSAAMTHQPNLSQHAGWVYSVAYSPNGRYIVSASEDKTVQIWDSATGVHLQSLSGHEGWIYNAVYSPDGRYIVSASVDKTVRVWNATTGALLQTLFGHEDWVNSAAYSPDGRCIVSASRDGTMRVWDAATGVALQTLPGNASSVISALYSPDGCYIISVSVNKTIQIWNTTTGTLLQTLFGHEDWVNSAAYSPDGRCIVSASRDGTVQVWDAATGAHLRTLFGHMAPVRSAGYSPDGRYIVSASDDKTMRVWDAAAGRQLACFYGEGGIRRCAWSPDGVHLTAGDEMGRVLFLRYRGGDT